MSNRPHPHDWNRDNWYSKVNLGSPGYGRGNPTVDLVVGVYLFSSGILTALFSVFVAVVSSWPIVLGVLVAIIFGQLHILWGDNAGEFSRFNPSSLMRRHPLLKVFYYPVILWMGLSMFAFPFLAYHLIAPLLG